MTDFDKLTKLQSFDLCPRNEWFWIPELVDRIGVPEYRTIRVANILRKGLIQRQKWNDNIVKEPSGKRYVKWCI